MNLVSATLRRCATLLAALGYLALTAQEASAQLLRQPATVGTPCA